MECWAKLGTETSSSPQIRLNFPGSRSAQIGVADNPGTHPPGVWTTTVALNRHSLEPGVRLLENPRFNQSKMTLPFGIAAARPDEEEAGGRARLPATAHGPPTTLPFWSVFWLTAARIH